MDRSLQELFSVILQSEKVAFDEKKMCREAKEKIEIIQIRLEKQTETRKECIQKIEKLEDGLVKSMLGAKFMKSKEEFLTTRLATLQNEFVSEAQQLEQLNLSYERSSTNFMSLVQEFSKSYSLSSNGREVRDSEARAQKKILESQLNNLKYEVKNFEQRNEELAKIISHLEEVIEQKKAMDDEKKALDNEIANEENKMKSLQMERYQLETQPETDESFVLLKNELQHYNTCDLEKTAKDLQAELNHLHDLVKQKESQKLTQQYRQWQRQRQQMLQQENKKLHDPNSS